MKQILISSKNSKLKSFLINFPAMDQVATVSWLDANDTCGGHSIYIPILLAFPYLSRFFQCLRQYHDTKDKTCLLNGAFLLCFMV